MKAVFFVLSLLSMTFSHALTTHQLESPTHLYGYSGNAGGWWVGFILGPILFFCAFVCIWYNEKRAAIDTRRLNLAHQIVQDVDVTSQQSAMSKDGKLVYGTGQTRTNNVIGDRLTGVNGPNLIKIVRLVEVLEWRRHTRKINDHTQEYYELEWVSRNSPNQGGRHNNPANWFINNQTIYNDKVFLGGYNLSPEVANLCTREIPYNPDMSVAQNILRNTNRFDRQPAVQGGYIYFNTQGMNGGEGSLRVRFSLCPTGPISIVGASQGATFKPFAIARYEGTQDQTNTVPDCCCCCISACYAELLKPIEYILQVHETYISKDQIFDKAVEKSSTMTWIFRLLSFICIVLGIYLFFSPIANILGYIPLLGGILKGIVGFVIFLAALIIAIPLFILFTAIAWLVWHPKVGLILLAIAGVVLTLVLVLGRGGQPEQGSQQSHQEVLHQAIIGLRSFT